MGPGLGLSTPRSGPCLLPASPDCHSVCCHPSRSRRRKTARRQQTLDLQRSAPATNPAHRLWLTHTRLSFCILAPLPPWTLTSSSTPAGSEVYVCPWPHPTSAVHTLWAPLLPPEIQPTLLQQEPAALAWTAVSSWLAAGAPVLRFQWRQPALSEECLASPGVAGAGKASGVAHWDQQGEEGKQMVRARGMPSPMELRGLTRHVHGSPWLFLVNLYSQECRGDKWDKSPGDRGWGEQMKQGPICRRALLLGPRPWTCQCDAQPTVPQLRAGALASSTRLVPRAGSSQSGLCHSLRGLRPSTSSFQRTSVLADPREPGQSTGTN